MAGRQRRTEDHMKRHLVAALAFLSAAAAIAPGPVIANAQTAPPTVSGVSGCLITNGFVQYYPGSLIPQNQISFQTYSDVSQYGAYGWSGNPDFSYSGSVANVESALSAAGQAGIGGFTVVDNRSSFTYAPSGSSYCFLPETFATADSVNQSINQLFQDIKNVQTPGVTVVTGATNVAGGGVTSLQQMIQANAAPIVLGAQTISGTLRGGSADFTYLQPQ
jgi:hypothetical protein